MCHNGFTLIWLTTGWMGSAKLHISIRWWLRMSLDIRSTRSPKQKFSPHETATIPTVHTMWPIQYCNNTYSAYNVAHTVVLQRYLQCTQCGPYVLQRYLQCIQCGPYSTATIPTVHTMSYTEDGNNTYSATSTYI